jgi:hypothetical protein
MYRKGRGGRGYSLNQLQWSIKAGLRPTVKLKMTKLNQETRPCCQPQGEAAGRPIGRANLTRPSEAVLRLILRDDE